VQQAVCVDQLVDYVVSSHRQLAGVVEVVECAVQSGERVGWLVERAAQPVERVDRVVERVVGLVEPTYSKIHN
jgi:hypothetical protein